MKVVKIIFSPVLFLLFLVGYIIYNIKHFIGYISDSISNIKEKPDYRQAKDIVAIDYFGIILPDFESYFVYKKGFDLTKIEIDSKYPYQLSDSEFKELVKILNDNKLINKKSIQKSSPFVSFGGYRSLFCIDGGEGSQRIIIYFKDGSTKYISGFSDETWDLLKFFWKSNVRDYVENKSQEAYKKRNFSPYYKEQSKKSIIDEEEYDIPPFLRDRDNQ